MSLPYAFLAGLLVVVSHRELSMPLPGEGTVDDLLLAVGLLLLPYLLACWARASAMRTLCSGVPARVPPQSLLRLSMLAVPSVVHVLFDFGHYGDWVDRLSLIHI